MRRNLIAARLAADVCGTPTFVLARTDAESAKTDQPPMSTSATASFITGERTAEGFFSASSPAVVLAHCIKRGIAFAKYARSALVGDLDAEPQGGKRIRRGPYTRSIRARCWPITAPRPSNWEANIDKATIAKFQREIGRDGV